MTCHVRDPKVWKDGDSYTMVLGSRRKDDVGEILVYRSSDLKDVEAGEPCHLSETPFGYMWECPDCFNLDGVPGSCHSRPRVWMHRTGNINNIYQSGYCRLEGDLYGDYDTDCVLRSSTTALISMHSQTYTGSAGTPHSDRLDGNAGL